MDQLIENSTIKEHKKDKLLFMTGDEAKFFYVIITGWVKLYRETRDGHESVISVLANHDIFGKTAILKKGTFTYTAEAITDSTILQIPASFMIAMAEDHEHFDHFLNKFLEAQIDESNKRFLEAEHLSKMTSAQRVACFLLRLCRDQKEDSASLKLPYEKSLVAGKLGMTPETFSRSLNQLSSVGVETTNATVVINNVPQLRASTCSHCSAMREECLHSEEEYY